MKTDGDETHFTKQESIPDSTVLKVKNFHQQNKHFDFSRKESHQISVYCFVTYS